jgi:hypothetical protein
MADHDDVYEDESSTSDSSSESSLSDESNHSDHEFEPDVSQFDAHTSQTTRPQTIDEKNSDDILEIESADNPTREQQRKEREKLVMMKIIHANIFQTNLETRQN